MELKEGTLPSCSMSQPINKHPFSDTGFPVLCCWFLSSEIFQSVAKVLSKGVPKYNKANKSCKLASSRHE